MALEYIREYHTYFHVNQSYGISKSSCYKGIKWVEDTLYQASKFCFPGRKALFKSNMECDVILDATETSIERQKKRVKNRSVKK
ncbi:putative transposase for insertion sequence element IS702 [Holospora obtusa F1]|uniref:Transposase for insertion sequence element IS702 n=1 Tax=Holospora obtusa F1 TaxID=1399147 RepID=W6THM5_HOLOB|nr:putative transposase for insertion sequence element IS702 [Holospora obtusa F1]